MPPLADVQAIMRDALVKGEAARALPLLVGGRDPSKRLAVHQRHYRASLVEALLTKFPATAWLMGPDFVAQAAQAFVRRHPPAAPCIAEFGVTFPDFIAEVSDAARAPYLRDFAMLEWHFGHASVAIEHASRPLQSLFGYPQDALLDLVLRLQAGAYYLKAGWPVDDLARLYLEDSAPDRYTMEPMDVRLEVRGARGSFDMTRLDPAVFEFRRALLQGHSIGVAAEMALDQDAGFDPGVALAAVMGEGLVVAIEPTVAGVSS